MKIIYSILFAGLFFVGCQPKPDNSAKEAFEKNSKTVMTYLEGIQNESLDYSSVYSVDVIQLDTHAGTKKDSLGLEDIKANDKKGWAFADFKIVSELNLLPGVNPETKETDGSVRYYGDWEITIPGTDSTEAKSAVVRLYESFDFDEEGKIIFQQYYGDFGGLQKLLGPKEIHEEEGEEHSGNHD